MLGCWKEQCRIVLHSLLVMSPGTLRSRVLAPASQALTWYRDPSTL